jgi:hypothetical protein
MPPNSAAKASAQNCTTSSRLAGRIPRAGLPRRQAAELQVVPAAIVVVHGGTTVDIRMLGRRVCTAKEGIQALAVGYIKGVQYDSGGQALRHSVSKVPALMPERYVPYRLLYNTLCFTRPARDSIPTSFLNSRDNSTKSGRAGD